LEKQTSSCSKIIPKIQFAEAQLHNNMKKLPALKKNLLLYFPRKRSTPHCASPRGRLRVLRREDRSRE
jgi:hypothetical protein